ncbi:sulfatase-like hydrolase/transferase [Spirosoma sp. HMF3257]|uniref:Sulfatase N-terminal domain-containing protein n=1 Tax=Spirosoma telluris TaxID=2183553 RepID=A0A327NS00_9BACT|nr:sulfatase-like hydrolase/transferase [Spirosoma telluris]RAI78027.1 hypothetical protein HMF3257_35125 [Spirosoma telluris]
MYSDDQRYNTIHALGNDDIQTPNLDRLAKQGVAFTRAQTMGGMHGALCVPSRAMLHTGRYLNDLQKSGDVIPAEHTTLPEYLQTKGYQTYVIGKWHNDKASFARSYTGGAALFFGVCILLRMAVRSIRSMLTLTRRVNTKQQKKRPIRTHRNCMPTKLFAF